MRTLDRYVIREILPPFLLSLLIFTFILEIPPVMRSLEQLVAKGVSWGVAGRILLTLVPQGLGLTIPMATLTGILIGLGRLSADRESVALLACGVSPYRMLRPVMAFALLMAGATTYVMLQAIPDANQAFREITFELVSKKVKSDIRPRMFFDEFPGFVLYARDETPGGGWRDVMVADTRKAGNTDVFFAGHGDLSIDRPNQRVDLILSEGRRYSTGQPGQSEVYSFPRNPGVIISLDPKTVFNRQELPRTITEKTLADLRVDAAAKLNAKPVPLSPHPEILYAQQKFSIPVACLVFGIIGLALGLTSARDTKMAGFVVGFAVVFAYYAVLLIAENQTKGHYRAIEEAQQLGTASWVNAHLARWWPNIIMGAFGIAALTWRAQFAQRGLPLSLPVRMPQLPTGWHRDTRAPAPSAGGASTGARPRRVIMVVRFPRIRLPGPGVLDRYISRLYLRIVGLSFLGLLGLFWIAAFLDRSEKIFKGQATIGQVFQFLAYSTPQFVYFIIPIAALLSVLVTFGQLSRTSELTVLKACGVSLYRTALPVVFLSLLGSAALYTLEQRVLAESNRKAEALDDAIRGRPVRSINPLNRQWIAARDGGIYHYGLYDPQQRMLTSLSVYKPADDAWRLQSHTFATSAEYRHGEWTGVKGWARDYSKTPPTFSEFARRSMTLEAPEYFGTEQPIAQLMTVAELRKHIADLRASGFNWMPLAVELQRKIAFPFVTVVMTLLAVPFGVSTGRRGTLYGIGIGIVIALAYWIVSSVFIAIGSAGLLPPFLAAWSPNIIVAGTAAFLFLNTRT